MRRFKQLLKNLWKNRLVNIYVIQELDKSGEDVKQEYYFKKRKNRDLFHSQLIVLDSSEHYAMWCDFREYQIGPESWKKYMQSVNIIDKYILLDGKVTANDIRVNYYSYEEAIKRENSQIKD